METLEQKKARAYDLLMKIGDAQTSLENLRAEWNKLAAEILTEEKSKEPVINQPTI